MIKVAAFVGMR